MLKHRYVRTAAATLAALCLLFLVSMNVHAQALRGPMAIDNNTTCTVEICTSNGAACFLVPPGSQTVNIPCGTDAIAVRTCGGLRVIPLESCANRIRVGNNCCADVCFSAGIVACTFFLTINPAPTPCLCPID
ncbi:MAG TPA: hypothetical protein VHI13_18180 [Candidatus Kapabacteria bacterium]|nr:hypothetical protein [Candidatus Kapabacteria bacterium]